jgi:YfiH family protein
VTPEFSPTLTRHMHAAVAWHTDPDLLERDRILVAFSERTGGVSAPPFDSLDLGASSGDELTAVDLNRERMLEALGITEDGERLTTAEQVHGDRVSAVTDAEAGAGGRTAGARGPITATDALLTLESHTPLLMCYADCVPVVVVATAPVRAVCVVHSGWRGSLARIAGKAAASLAARSRCDTSDLIAYIGPHICPECYPVSDELLWRFEAEFGTLPVARGQLDLGAVVSGSLRDAGVPIQRQVRLDVCTAEATERFYSYRAEGVTGRHGALAVVL